MMISRYSCQCRRKLRRASVQRLGRLMLAALTACLITGAGAAGFNSIVSLTPHPFLSRRPQLPQPYSRDWQSPHRGRIYPIGFDGPLREDRTEPVRAED